MAIVKEFICKTGVRIVVHDDCYAHLQPEELAERKRQIQREIRNVAISAARSKATEMQPEEALLQATGEKTVQDDTDTSCGRIVEKQAHIQKTIKKSTEE